MVKHAIIREDVILNSYQNCNLSIVRPMKHMEKNIYESDQVEIDEVSAGGDTGCNGICW